MMSKEKRRVPKLRFPGFTEDWEQRKLGDYLIQYTEITTQNNQYPVLTSSRKGLFFQTDYYDGNQIASKDNTGYNIVPYGYFTYRHMSDDDIFHFNINYIVDKGIVSTLYPVFTTKNLNSNYLQLQLNYGTEFRKYAVLLKQGGSRTYMYFNKLRDLKLTISTSFDEQEIIANFFIAFEKLITLHQRKLDNLKLKKKALLQKLFPKNGERYPELRFPGFTDAWEQRKLGQFTARVTRKNAGQSDLPLTISAQDGLVDQRKYFNRQVASRDMSNYYLIKKGEFAYNKSYSEGYPFGAVKRLDYYDIGALSTLYILFEITDKNISSDFIVSYYMTHLWYKEISKRAAEGARNHGLLNISTEDFFDSELNIPNSIEEQVKIGNFIKQFDT
ncbi:MAG: restriction endonuclease subunit S [Veillonella sp.]|nr:restriction endonuclease subunit S [Veillonella sp.]MDU2576492.1 restriction endonuclease subunit S [Veillonella sp.]